MYAVYVAMQIELRAKEFGAVGTNEALSFHFFIRRASPQGRRMRTIPGPRIRQRWDLQGTEVGRGPSFSFAYLLFPMLYHFPKTSLAEFFQLPLLLPYEFLGRTSSLHLYADQSRFEETGFFKPQTWVRP